jgi:hypothetical protein
MVELPIWLSLAIRVLVGSICLIGGLATMLRYGYRRFLVVCGAVLFCIGWVLIAAR